MPFCNECGKHHQGLNLNRPCLKCRHKHFEALFDQSGIYLHDRNGEIVMWSPEEWREDPDVVISIANAIRIGYEQGPKALRALLSSAI